MGFVRSRHPTVHPCANFIQIVCLVKIWDLCGMKTVLIARLVVVTLLTVGLATVSAEPKISAQDFVSFIFRQLNALTDHHAENVSDCVESVSKCSKAMERNVKRDDDTLAGLDKLTVPSCLEDLRTYFRGMLLAHREVSSTYVKVIREGQPTDADVKKVGELQRRERVEMVAILDEIVSDVSSICSDNAGDTVGPGKKAAHR